MNSTHAIDPMSRKIGHFFLCLAVVIAGLAGLKLDLGSISQWAMTGTALIGFTLLIYRGQVFQVSDVKSKLGPYSIIFLPWFLLAISVLIAGILNNQIGLSTIPKFLILGLLMVVLVRFRPSTNVLIIALVSLAGFALAGLLYVAILGYESWLILPPHRFGWNWAPPGVFWKAGIYLLPLACWWVLNRKCTRLSRWAILVLSCLIVGLDGSRTGSLLALIIWLASSGLFAWRILSLKAAVKRSVPLGLVMMITLGGINPSNINPLGFVNEYMVEVFGAIWDFSASGDSESGGAGRELGGDSIRLAMIKDSWEGVVNNFPIGGGFGSTTTQTSSMTEPMVVHMTYFQLLADLGLLGLLSYLAIFILPLAMLWKRLSRTEDVWGEIDRSILPLGVLCVYLFSGLFHPISNEISEWLVVLVAMALSFPRELSVERPICQ